MSRYTASDIQHLPKAKLIAYVERQPEVLFLTKICSRPIQQMHRSHLLRALTGKYGYVKAPLVSHAPSVIEASELASSISIPAEVVGMTPTDPTQREGRGSVSTVSAQYDPEDSSCVGPASPSDSYMEGGEESNIVTDTRSGFTDFDELEEHNANEAEYESIENTPIEFNRDTPIEFNQSYTHFRRSSVSPTPSESASVDQMSTECSSPTSTTSTASSPALSSSIPGHVIYWYDDETRASDEELLEQYFCQNPKFAAQISHLRSHKGKQRTDAELVRDYKFALEVFTFLMARKWENGRHILSASIVKYLGLTPPWFSRARRVIEILQMIGPGSADPDPLVLKRLSSRRTTGKVQAFLQARAKLATSG